MYRGNGAAGLQQGAYGPGGVPVSTGYGQMGMPQSGNMPVYDPQHGYIPQQMGMPGGAGGKGEVMGMSRQTSDSSQYPLPSASMLTASPQMGAKTSPGAQHMQSPGAQYHDQHGMMSGYGMMGGNGGSYRGGYDSSGYDGNDDIMNMPEDESEQYVDGAVHLSAGAKPFVPKFASSPAMTPSVPAPVMSSSASSTPAGSSGGNGSSELNSLSLPPISLGGMGGGMGMSDADGSGWGRFDANPSSWQQESHSSRHRHDDDDDDDLDSMMRMHVPLDILSFDGMGDTMGGLGGDDDLGESLLGRLAGGGDRRRNRGLFFGDSSSSGTSRFLGGNRDDDDDAIISHLISDVISSPNGNPQSMLFPDGGHGSGRSSSFPES
jgi:hypothetical protein